MSQESCRELFCNRYRTRTLALKLRRLWEQHRVPHCLLALGDVAPLVAIGDEGKKLTGHARRFGGAHWSQHRNGTASLQKDSFRKCGT
jgi:hypothetical protein